MSELLYRELAPAPDLATWVQCHWEFSARRGAAPRPHHVLPDGCVSIVCGLRQDGIWLGLMGPRTGPLRTVAEPGQVVRGVRFRPEGAGALLGIEPRRFRDRHVPLGSVMPELEDSLRTRIGHSGEVDVVTAFTAALRELLPQARAVDPQMHAAVEALTLTDGAMSIAELARRVCLSERQLQRRFGAAVGLTPKQFARIRRLRSTVGDALASENAGWSRLAAQLGFADQAHMIREFSALTGQSPESFLSHTRGIEHVDVRP